MCARASNAALERWLRQMHRNSRRCPHPEGLRGTVPSLSPSQSDRCCDGPAGPRLRRRIPPSPAPSHPRVNGVGGLSWPDPGGRGLQEG